MAAQASEFISLMKRDPADFISRLQGLFGVLISDASADAERSLNLKLIKLTSLYFEERLSLINDLIGFNLLSTTICSVIMFNL